MPRQTLISLKDDDAFYATIIDKENYWHVKIFTYTMKPIERELPYKQFGHLRSSVELWVYELLQLAAFLQLGKDYK